MRGQTREFVATFFRDHPCTGKLLDVGCMNVNGSIRGDVPIGIEYHGVDMREGNEVDEVLNGHELSKYLGEEGYDVVTCFDTFEHDDAFWLTMEEMKKVCKKGGWILIGAPSRRCPLHLHPNDYWRFMGPSFELLLKGTENVFIHIEHPDSNDSIEDEIYGYGQKT